MNWIKANNPPKPSGTFMSDQLLVWVKDKKGNEYAQFGNYSFEINGVGK